MHNNVQLSNCEVVYQGYCKSAVLCIMNIKYSSSILDARRCTLFRTGSTESPRDDDEGPIYRIYSSYTRGEANFASDCTETC